MRRTKTIANMGPATVGSGIVRALLEAGVDVFRANLSQGDDNGHALAIAAVWEAAAERGRCVTVLEDLQGPRIRVRSLPSGSVHLRDGWETSA